MIGLILVAWLPGIGCGFGSDPAEAAFALDPGMRVAIAGDGLALDMARHGYLESALHLAFPEANVTVRSFAEEGFRLDRSPSGLGAALKAFAPDVIFLCTGWNESFDGPEAAAEFGKVLRDRCAEWSQSTPGKQGARIELIPPVPYIQLLPGMPDAASAEDRIAPYLEEIRSAAEASGRISYLDRALNFPALASELTGPVSRDGRHLNRRGHWLLAMLLAEGLSLPQGGGGVENPAQAEEIRQRVIRKQAAWDDSAGQSEQRGRAWDEAIWSAATPGAKAGLASLWAEEPEDMEPCPEAPQSLGMPLPGHFGLAQNLSSADAEAGVRGPKFVRINLWASEDGVELWNPVSLRFDGEGRAWAGCAPPGQPACLVRIEDTDGDHRSDRQSVFVSGPIHPGGFLPAPGGVYVSTGTGLWWYVDRDGDGAADHWERRLGGSGARHGLRWGPDGSVWFQEPPGKGGGAESPWGIVPEDHGGMRRWNPRTSQIETRLRFYAGAVDLCFEHGSTPLVVTSSESWPVPLDRAGDWKEMPALPEGDRFALPGRPGCMLMGDQWPKALRDTYVRPEKNAAGQWELASYEPVWDGSIRGWRKQPDALMMSADPNFSPVAVEPGPDGALYVLDACGKESPLRAGSWGRIWRIASSRLPPVWEMAGSGKTAGTLLGELCRAAPERGWSLRLELWQRPDEEVFGAWSERFNSLPANDPSRDRLLLEGLRLHQAFGVPDLSLLSRLTDAADPNARLAACDVLADWFRILPGAPALLHRLVEDENPRVRLAALDSARRVGTPEAGDLARLSLHQRMDGDLRRVSEATIAALGGPDHAPPSLRAKAMAMSTTELIAAPLTPPAASVLLERSGVENAALRQAANLLSARSGLSLERWIVARLEDRNSPGELIDNLVKLLTMTEGWELYQSGTQLQSIAQNIDRLEVRRAVYGALAIGAAESQTLDALLARVEASGDYEVTTFYEGCAQVLTHPKLRAAIAPAIRNELGNDDSATRLAGRRLRITAPGWGVLHFAELEAFAGDQNVAHGRPVKQSEATGPTRWWSTLAKNGVNGIRDWQAELPLKGLSPDSVPVRGVMAGNVAGGDPFWEVDFESSVPIDRLVYFPGERLPAARTLRFELFDPSGQVVWRATRATSNADPLEINLDMAAQRIQQAVAVARLLGDEFTKSLETVARHSALLPARFSAMRALRRMGVELQGLRMRTVDVVAGADGFDLSMLSVHAQDAIELTVRNESGKELNLAWFEDETAKSPVVALGTVASSQRGRFPFVVPSRPGAAWIRPVELIGKERLRLPVEVSGTPESAPGKK